MSPRRAVPQEVRDAAVAAYLAGYTTDDIRRALGIARMSVATYVNAAGHQHARDRGYRTPPGLPQIDDWLAEWTPDAQRTVLATRRTDEDLTDKGEWVTDSRGIRRFRPHPEGSR